jgi:hypothetical protein
VYVVKVPGGIRDYGNVTLHIARTSTGLGKTKIKETKHLRLPRRRSRPAQLFVRSAPGARLTAPACTLRTKCLTNGSHASARFSSQPRCVFGSFRRPAYGFRGTPGVGFKIRE